MPPCRKHRTLRAGADWGNNLLLSRLREGSLKIPPPRRRQVIGEIIDHRLAGRDFLMDDVIVRNARQMLDQRAQRIAVGGNDDALASA